MKKKILKELGFLVISLLLVAFSYMISGTFFMIWIKDFKLLAIMTVAFYLIIGFYRMLNHLARKHRDEHEDQ